VKNPFLVGDRVYLRPLEKEDAPLFVTWLNDREVARTLLRHHPINLPAEEEFIAQACARDDALALGIVLRETDRLIGSAGLMQINWRNRHAGFGILIGAKEEWGKGYGTEATALVVRHAFETLNLNRVWLHAYEFNPRGLRAYEKAGFKREGVLRQDTFCDGRYWDTVVMAVLRDEWQPPAPP
jgi:RimJ/RimL family protein N-acetyltransferase